MRLVGALAILFSLMLCGSYAFAEVVSADCPDHPETQKEIKKLEADIFSSQGAVIAGHAQKIHDKYLCVNGFKIYPGDKLAIQVGLATYRQFDRIWPNSYVEIQASLDHEKHRLLADVVSVQFTLAGYVHKFVYAAGTFKVMQNSVLQDRKIDPLCLGEMDVVIMSGLRTPQEDMHSFATLIRFGELVDMQNLRWSTLTGIIRKNKKIDNFGKEEIFYTLGQSRLKATDMDIITKRLGQHVALYGVWSRDMEGDVLDVALVKDTPLTALYAKSSDKPLFFSLEQYLTRKDDRYTFYDLPVEDEIAEPNSREESKDRWPLVAYGMLPAGGSPTISGMIRLGKVHTFYSQFDRGWPLQPSCFMDD